MIAPAELTIYQRARAGRIPAADALALARFAAREPRYPLPEYGAPSTFTLPEYPGWTFRASLDYDEGYSLDDLGYGHFDAGREDWRTGYRHPTEPGAIPNPAAGDSRLGSRGDAFYVPSQDRAELTRYYNGPTYGASRSVALDLARAAERAELARVTDDYGPTVYVVSLAVMREGVTLGRASMGGVELAWSDVTRTNGHEYLAEVLDDLIPEALADGRATLARLAAGTED